MKKLGKILTLVIATMAVAVCAIMFTACGSKANTYKNTYAIENGTKPASPVAANGGSVANGFAKTFGNFVDKVSCDATLVIDGENYTFTWQVNCGTDSEENVSGSYTPEYVWTGKVLEATDTSVKLGAAETAKVTINGTKQFATNAETTSYFGTPGYVATHETTDCPHKNVAFGEKLLKMFSAGTYAVSGDTLGEFTAD